jgi:hypothetical protein
VSPEAQIIAMAYVKLAHNFEPEFYSSNEEIQDRLNSWLVFNGRKTDFFDRIKEYLHTAIPQRTLEEVLALYKFSELVYASKSNFLSDWIEVDLRSPQDLYLAWARKVTYEESNNSTEYASSNIQPNLYSLPEFEDAYRLSADFSNRAIEQLRDRWSSNSDSDVLSANIEYMVPASDRIVTINHNQPEYSVMAETIESANEFIRVSNAFPVEEKGWIKKHIELGLELLKQPRTYLYALIALILKPLYAAYAIVAEDAAKAAILAAIDAVKMFFGIA